MGDWSAPTSGQIAPVVSSPYDRAWYRSATVYQVYPASFSSHPSQPDSPHGTLKGIASRLPYLKELGVDIVWLSPIYKSPQADMGYDISDYQAIDEQYGTMEDWEGIRDGAHRLGMKLVMDLVVNHTSNEHPWFKESRSSKTNPKRDWYIWRDAKYDKDGKRHPPNNWKGTFGAGSAWTWDEETEQYYLHLFLSEQPDLNWENQAVRQAVYEMMHWWLRKGADGFRMDVINFIAKAPGLPDAPVTLPDREFQPYGEMTMNRPEVHKWLKEMNQEVLSKYDCFAVGECPGGDAVERFSPYSLPANKELQMVFHFHHQGIDRAHGGFTREWNSDWKLSEMKRVFSTWQVEMNEQGGWNSNYLENHDQPRCLTRFASDHPEDRSKSAKLMSMFHCSLGGTLFVYQGQEIGMSNVPKDWGEAEYKDIETIREFEGARERGEDIAEVRRSLRMTARDNGRTPMQWDTSPNAGFSTAPPWMRIHDDYKEGWNVAQQKMDPRSPLVFWQNMLKVRKEYEALIYGKFVPLDESSEKIFAYVRDDPTIQQRLLVVLNFARGQDGRGEEVRWTVPEGVDVGRAKLVIGNGGGIEAGSGIEGREITLGKWEGRIYVL